MASGMEYMPDMASYGILWFSGGARFSCLAVVGKCNRVPSHVSVHPCAIILQPQGHNRANFD
jgi:hypothetical protein